MNPSLQILLNKPFLCLYIPLFTVTCLFRVFIPLFTLTCLFRVFNPLFTLTCLFRVFNPLFTLTCLFRVLQSAWISSGRAQALRFHLSSLLVRYIYVHCRTKCTVRFRKYQTRRFILSNPCSGWGGGNQFAPPLFLLLHKSKLLILDSSNFVTFPDNLLPSLLA